MKVYLVYGCWDYEGEHAESIRVFSSSEKAEQYRQKLLDEGDYDSVDVDEREVDAE